METLTKEQEELLLKALENGKFGRVNLFVGLGLISLGLAIEVQNSHDKGWDAHLKPTRAGYVFANIIKQKLLAQHQKTDYFLKCLELMAKSNCDDSIIASLRGSDGSKMMRRSVRIARLAKYIKSKLKEQGV